MTVSFEHGKQLVSEQMNTGTLKVNMQQFRKKFNVTSDNVKLHEAVMRNKGSFFTLDSRPYKEELRAFGIFYTFTPE